MWLNGFTKFSRSGAGPSLSTGVLYGKEQFEVISRVSLTAGSYEVYEKGGDEKQPDRPRK